MAKSINSIRINSGVKRVEVNDNGDFITLRSDMDFINKVKNLSTKFIELGDKISEEREDMADAEQFDLIYEVHKEMHDDIDEVFGKDTCKKVFGDGVDDVIPTADIVLEFIYAIMPYITELMQEKAKETPKYSAKRVGSGK